MAFLFSMFTPPPFPANKRDEVMRLIDEMVNIGKKEDFLSELPGGLFNAQCRHIRARKIGDTLHLIGGLDLMTWAFKKIRQRVGKVLASHLEYAWADVGEWKA